MNIDKYDIEYQDYLDQKMMYEKSSFVSKMISRITGKVPKKPEPLRFAIRYSSIGMPFRKSKWYNCGSYYGDMERYYVDEIPDENQDTIGDLWTVVEYNGNGIFTDLVTGQKFRLAFNEKEITETIESYRKRSTYLDNEEIIKANANIQKNYQDYCEIPLAIADSDSLHRLDVDIKESILDNTVPKREEISKILARKEEKARNAVIQTFKDDLEGFDERAENVRKKIEEENRKRIEREEQEAREKAEEKRREELRKIQAEEKEKIVGPKFDEMFGQGYKK